MFDDDEDEDEELGTSRWFGAAWPSPSNPAPVCDPRSHVDTPVGEICPQCGYVIRDGDRGVGIPHLGRVEVHYRWYHQSCFFGMIGVPVQVAYLPGDEPPHRC